MSNPSNQQTEQGNEKREQEKNLRKFGEIKQMVGYTRAAYARAQTL